MMSSGQAAGFMASLAKKVQVAEGRLTALYAHEFQAEVVKGITNQKPGGTPWEPLAASTLMQRQRKEKVRNPKILIVTGQLRRSVIVRKVGQGYFVGVLRQAQHRDKSGTRSLANIAAVHEFGTHSAGRSRNVIIPRRSFLQQTYDKWVKKKQAELPKDWQKALGL